MATLSEWKLLIKFSKDTKAFNPNMYRDIKNGIYVPCRAMNEHIKRYYKDVNYESKIYHLNWRKNETN